MVEKTYVADVAFESIRRGQVFVSEETQRLSALLGAGYIHEMSGPVYAAVGVETGDGGYRAEDDSDEELLEHFEELDVVEVSPQPVARKRRTRRE